MSTHAWHALAALGTDGGQPCADGDLLARGVHLLWSIRPELGFPRDGYDVWRRRHRAPEWACFNFEDALDPMPASNEWTWLGFRLEASPGEILLDEFACGKLPGLHLPGSRTFLVHAAAPSIGLRASGSGAPPLVDVLIADGEGGLVLAAQQRAQAKDGDSWTIDLWSDGIAAVRFTAEDLRLCGLCFGLPMPNGGWDRLNDDPILLPVVAPGSTNEAANIHSPTETEAVAAGRLSQTLDPSVRRRLSTEFAGDLRELSESLLRDGNGSAVPTQADESLSARMPPTLGLQSAVLVALSAIDPDVSRMFGLYWHDPVDTAGPWDYKVVAHHGAIRYPARTVGFEDLTRGPVATPTLERDGLSFVGNNGLEIVTIGFPFTARTALRFTEPRLGTVCGVLLASPAASITLHVGSGLVIFSAWRGGAQVASAPSIAGEVLLEHGPGIDAVTWTAGPVDLVDVELRPETGVVGDLVAFGWTLSPGPPQPVRTLSIDEAAAAAEGTRLLANGTVDPSVGVVGLDWGIDNAALDVGRPLRVHVARSGRGDGEAPEATGPFAVLNEAEPALAFARAAGPRAEWPGPDVPHRWTERGLVPGWYAWRVRGIDAFGRLGAWSPERVVDVRPAVPPPPPDLVSARALDPHDRHLSDADRALVDADGAGLFVEWSWTAERRLRAPQVEPSGEFRVYVRRGDPNVVEGHVTAVVGPPSSTRLVTDVAWTGAPNAFVGERVRLGRASFTIVAHGSGPQTWIEVASPSVGGPGPGAGPFTIAVPAGGRAGTDLTDPRSFQMRVHAEAVGPLARVTTRVVSVVKHGLTATVTLEAPLPDAGGEPLPGLLVSRGFAFPVRAQTPGSAVVDVAAVVQPDGTAELPGEDDACTLWAGARYSAWLPGVVLGPTPREAVARGLVAVSTSDGDPAVADDPVWSKPGRGGLGGRAGREGRTSRVTRIDVPHRTPPAPVVVARPPEQDGDIPADQAEPADWYGRARYALAFDTVTNATGYRVLRASTAALFDRDRILRQTATAPYEHGPFDDGGASAAWLAENHPSVSVADLTADLSKHPDPLAVVAAWRGWSAWFYPTLLNKEVMDLAEIEGNQEAFRAAHEGTITSSPFHDTLDGRGLGRFVYRVRSVDASGNAGEWSPAFPLVEVRDVTPPKTPTLIGATAFDNTVLLAWRANREPDLLEYRVWRSEDRATLEDVRRLVTAAVVAPTPGEIRVAHLDENLAGLRTHFYRVAAVDAAGNVSEPTPIVPVRVPDSKAPFPPEWNRAEWVRVDGAGAEYAYDDPAASSFVPAVALRWLALEPGLTATVERRLGRERTWRAIARGLAPSDAQLRFEHVDSTARPDELAEFRIRLTDQAGNTNLRFVDAVSVAAP